jgi:hypothetical protein
VTVPRRPGPVPVALAALCAALNVWFFHLADWNGMWASILALFLVEELWAAWVKTGGTFSERWWDWLGIRPRRPWRLPRIAAAGVFLGVLLLHIVTGGAFWWSGGLAIIGTAIPVVVVVLYALAREREDSVGLVGDVKTLLKLRAARNRLREAAKVGKVKVVLFSLLGAVASGAVAQITGACPDLLSAAPAIAMAGVGGAVTFLMRKPLQSAGTKALLTGLGSVVFAGVVQQVNEVCGAGFVDKIPALAVAGAWVGLGLWLQAPHESPGATPPSIKG